MRWLHRLPLVLALSMLVAQGAGASTAYGDLNNFDVVNDTGTQCHGFEIEIDDIHSTDITYTYDWNHYGAPRIREDNADPAHPKVFVRYESAKNVDGTWAAYTAIPAGPLPPTGGHSCTNPGVNEGCEHFGVGNYGIPTAVRYFWLVDDGSGKLVRGPAVMVASPSWSYAAPAGGQPAQVVAVIPAPVVPIPVNKQYGEPSWVKVIKTTTHNANKIVLQDLISDDADEDGVADWQNQEPAEVESEWKLLQTNSRGDAAKDELEGGPDDMGDGDETVTRRYEFYKYTGDALTIDGENGEAMCDEVDPTTNPADPQYLHGVGIVDVTDASGNTYQVDCSAQVVVGDYIGAQMAGFDAATPLGLVDNIQDGELSTPYTPRTVVVGGNTPFVIAITGNFPPGLEIGANDGVLSGTPGSSGDFSFTVDATDADNTAVSKAYTMKIVGSESCPAGTFSATGSAPCTDAPAGSYASGTGNTAATFCPAGTFSSATGAAECTPAPAGSFASGTGNTAATFCPAGTFSSATGAAECTPAPAGSFASGTGNTAATFCPAGTFSSATGAAECTPAPAGSFASGTGNTAATFCPAGTFSSATGAAECTPAPAGSFASGTGNTAATFCPAGTFSSATGAAECTAAPAGSFASGTGNTAATFCPAGTFSSATGAAECTPAPAGSFASGTGNTSATPCPAGTTSEAGASACTPIATVAQQLSDAIDAALSDNPGLANSMHKQADGISSAPNANAKAGKLKAFINHVNAQRGKALTPAEADNLIALAMLL